MTSTDDETLAAYLRERAIPAIPTSGLDLADVLASSRRKHRARLGAVTALTVAGLATGVAGVMEVAELTDDPIFATGDAQQPLGPAAPATPTEPTASEGPGPIDSSWADKARAGGASDEQVAILDDGHLTFDEYEAAVARALSCIRDAGIEVRGGTLPQSPGFPVISYSYESASPGRTSKETQAISDDCLATHSYYVEAAYQTSPAVREGVNAQFESYREAIIACVRANNGDVSEEADQGEVLTAVNKVLTDVGVDCARKAGFR